MALFAEYGSVAKINMPIDRETGRPRGFAFVNMSNAEEHAAAIAALNESEVGGRTIFVSESVPKEKYAANKDKYDATRKPRTERRAPRGTKIYVGNLSFDTTMEDVQAAFSEFGEVKDCFVPLDYDGNPRGFAFVTLDDDNALAAIEGMDGVELGGRTLNVKKSLPKESKPRDRY
jgi:RNA recognition motif-containing protein